MSNTLGDAPIEPQYLEKMQMLARALDEVFNGDLRGQDRHTGFVLMVFGFGDTGRANYISNAERADVITLLKQQIARFEGQPETQGNA
jgi:hypothetical protein